MVTDVVKKKKKDYGSLTHCLFFISVHLQENAYQRIMRMNSSISLHFEKKTAFFSLNLG